MAELSGNGQNLPAAPAFCQVVLRESRRSFDRFYTYAIPEQLRPQLQIGSRVEVPFGTGNRCAEAFVTAMPEQADTDFQIKPVAQLLTAAPVLLADQIRLAARMRRQYLCTHGDALKCMVPAAVTAVKEKTVRMVMLVDPGDAQRRLADGELDRVGHIRVIELLLESESAPLLEVMRACSVSRAVLKTMEKNQLITVVTEKTRRQLADDFDYTLVKPHVLTPPQAMAVNRINQASQACSIDMSGCQEFLLFGVTGSGKTEVYLQVARQTVTEGRGVIILVPEIALTPQMIQRVRSRFGDAVAVLHSRLTPAERYEQWQRIMRREIKVVIGARSAIFAPLSDIGLIIIDEEQESTYKSETHPRYHARDIARMRAHDHSAVLVLGSATPSVETMYRCSSGRAIKLELADRIGSAGMARAEIVDMRQELKNGNRGIFSRVLSESMQQAFAANHQAIIFLNRRGYASFMLCRECGHVVKCASCSVSLTTHQNLHARPDTKHAEQLICHYCGRVSQPPQKCPACGSRLIGRFGVGTQQVEEMFNQTFAPYKALRMDQDTTSGRTAHARLLEQFAEGQADALIGTQMIAKGHDFPNVTVVGILSADLMLGLSDFRAGERAFQLITQAAGRAGRGSASGKVMIQTYNVDDYAIRYAAAQDYNGFYQQELAYRRMMKYPPFGSICCITLSGLREDQVRSTCRDLTSALRARREDSDTFQSVELMAPAKAPLYKIKDRFRWRIILKGKSSDLLMQYIMPVTDRFQFGQITIAIDSDPYQLW